MDDSINPTRRRSWLRSVGRVVRLLLVVCLLFVLLLMRFEERLIFVPSQYPEGNWHPDGLAFEEADFPSGDGTRLHGWYVPHVQPRAIVLFAHGNGGHLADRADLLRMMHDRLRVSVMIFDYRGYGRSEGTPNEEGVLADARAARAWLAERAKIAETEIVLLGRSLGGGVMVDLAAKDGARGLILESTFTSLPDVAATHYPWLPVRLLMRTRLDSLSKIGQYRGPLIQSHGTIDTIIPFALGRKLFDASPSLDKQFVEMPGIGHNDTPSEEYYRALDQWLERLPDDSP